MTQFYGTHQNRLDAKKRVSVPASFRAVLRAQSSDGEDTSAAPLVLRRSHQYDCIEGWSLDAFEALAKPLGEYDQFSEEHDDFATTLYADVFPAETDREGRIVLPDELIAHANLTEAVVFMGLGRMFQIWEPNAAEHRRAEARERTNRNRLTLRGSTAGNGTAPRAAKEVGGGAERGDAAS
ncbi:MAG TPA: division/cell wall cluster transcriptional repressor MraZ [Acetobacteraceae bacterium]|jgi:MraZ protein